MRDTLRDAIKELKIAEEVEDSPRIDEYEKLHLDHDREGVAGSPDLARVILEKIEASTVFIADVTAIGQVFGDEGKEQPKKLINPNVAIELGYALKLLGNSGLLMVMNDHYGTRNDLPFDLRAKAGPILFTLAPEADKQTITQEKAKLKGKLKEAITLCLAERTKTLAASQLAQSAASQITSANWESIGEKLRGSCNFLRVDSQKSGHWEAERWSITGGPRNPVCNTLIEKAGAMLLRSPSVRAGLPESVLSESNHSTRWFLFLKHRGYYRVENVYEESIDGKSVHGFLGRIPDLAQASFAVCMECSATEL